MQLEAKDITFRYEKKSPWLLKDVDLTINSGEKIALVGPSGYGKSTLSKILSGYLEPTFGSVTIDGKRFSKKGYCPVQMIHQHPELSVNPRWKMEKVLSEGYIPESEILEEMGIEREWLKRWPSELSGGELQRFCIARVLSPETKFLICDEISTMLDVITQAQIWEFILKIAKDRDLGLLVVTHNMALAEKISDKIIQIQNINKI